MRLKGRQRNSPQCYNPAVIPELAPSEWEGFLKHHPDAHLLQSTAWGELKSSFGWSVARVVSEGSGAQVLIRRLPLGLRIAYIPKGPVGELSPALSSTLDQLCKDRGAFMLKIEPDRPEGEDLKIELSDKRFQPSHQVIQPRQTMVIDLRGEEDALLSRMNQKTRYNVRLAGRRGVRVEPWGDLAGFGQMMVETGERDSFGIHSRAYYEKAYSAFKAKDECELLVARFEGIPVAAAMIFARGKSAYYLYGASSNLHREHMPTYLLQWEAILWARSKGCTRYDLWGIPDYPLEALEESFTSRSDGLWGVYRFKRGFGGRIYRTIGSWDRPYNRTLYSIYTLFASLRQT